MDIPELKLTGLNRRVVEAATKIERKGENKYFPRVISLGFLIPCVLASSRFNRDFYKCRDISATLESNPS